MAELTLNEIIDLRIFIYRLYDYLDRGDDRNFNPYRNKESLEMVGRLADKLKQVEDYMGFQRLTTQEVENDAS